jgi:F1F0 ATPase subunit 2
MPEIGILGVILSLAAGGAVGFVFFGGLWLTVKTMRGAKNPAALMFFSLVVRMVIFVAAFYVIAKWGNWVYLVIALASAIVVRIVMIRTVAKDTFDTEKKTAEEAE